jgi:hypothetical protein
VGYFLSCPIPRQNHFVPTAASFSSFSPDVGTDSWYALDVRQGRVVLLLNTEDLIVWLPFSGEQFVIPEPPRSYQYCAGAVICADSPECRDPECYSLHNFCVILVDCEDSLATFDQIEFFEGNKTWASIYSLNENKWGYTYALKDNRYTEYPLIERNPPVLYRDALYLILETHELEGEEVRAALKFDLTDQKLSVVLAPEDANTDSGIFLATSPRTCFCWNCRR